MHFQFLESNKSFTLIYMTVGGKGERKRKSDRLVCIVDGAKNKELTKIIFGSCKLQRQPRE